MKGDYCTREGAERLKEQIEAYWACLLYTSDAADE